MTDSIVFIDSEIGVEDRKVLDLGAVRPDGAKFHAASLPQFAAFLEGADFVCGHNIVHHDLRYLAPLLEKPLRAEAIDTLYLSPLLFPQRPYHALLKDDKLQADELNNPLNDAEKARDLFYDELEAFAALRPELREIYTALLRGAAEFSGFFSYAGRQAAPQGGLRKALTALAGAFSRPSGGTEALIRREFAGKICENAPLGELIASDPAELAYALALIGTDDRRSITPPWLLRRFPRVERAMHRLRGVPCRAGCAYCREALDVRRKLKEFFGFDRFRTYGGEPLQEQAAQAAADGKSLLAVFPTGGGKSITFQLPALMAGRAERGLTVVISPLLSLMKDQVDNLSARGLTDAATVNGLLNPIERAEALERVASGMASLLYISPEQLRSRTIEKLLLSRHVARFVIDEAHCFSAWGHDFRVDYLYIGDFIRRLQEKKELAEPIPVSCFTATAKQKVIGDIRDYFREKLGVELALYASAAARENLRYAVLHMKSEEEKYAALRSLIEQKQCPTIVYASRTRRTREIAEKLTQDGFPARPYNGKMDPADKVANQEAFLNDEVRIIVATSAFGMGVDKPDVGLVVHYDISNSLENYIQEAGRAGRDPSLQADCCVLFHDGDLDKHFTLLNQTRLSIHEIQQVWTAMKDLTRERATVCCSPLEIARQAGWDDSVSEIETRVKTAVSALENAGYLRRGHNAPRIYATSILVKNMEEASFRLERSKRFTDDQRLDARRIMASLIASRSRAQGEDDAESRVDYLADRLGLEKRRVIGIVNLLRQEGLLADSMDMSAYLYKSDTQKRSSQILERFLRLERFLLGQLREEPAEFVLKRLNEAAEAAGARPTSVKMLRTLLYYLAIKGYIRKTESGANRSTTAALTAPREAVLESYERRSDLCRFLVKRLYELAEAEPKPEDAARRQEETLARFSLLGLHQDYLNEPRLGPPPRATPTDVEDALLYLSKIGAMKLEGGFLVLYNGMELKRLVLDNKIRYKRDDYKTLSAYYQHKIQQIHIVGEYANRMARDSDAALQFVQDYFQMDYRRFVQKYFKGERAKEIGRNISPERYERLFGGLSEAQSEIIHDAKSQYIVVAAGPGSGKTRVLVHKLASLLMLEEVKHEQLLMVTFSRAAATEFKKRLLDLIGNAANFVEIKTFHSYCFDLLGRIGSLEGSNDVVRDAAAMIERGEVEPGRTAKTVLVIDEAQDMDENEFALIRALMQCSEGMRVIAVGDDDQNIYEFRGSDSRYLRALVEDYGAARYEMTENYRSGRSIVALANAFARSIGGRMKTAEIRAVREEPGFVQITRHQSGHLEEPVVRQVLETWRGGTACVLTNTNGEALRVLGLLTRHGVRARLIQSADGFRLYQLAEVRFLLKTIRERLRSPVIGDADWEHARRRLQEVYETSACLETCLQMMDDFAAVNPRARYFTDFEEFIRESQYEDFCGGREAVFVSTIHKSKGREFDSVYMLLNRVSAETDADRRKLYVGLTRARNELYVHCNTDLFAPYALPCVSWREDAAQYPEPPEIVLQLTHRDVVLDFFIGKKRLICKLRSGAPLTLRGNALSAEIGGRTYPAAVLSKACMARLRELAAKGYRPDRAWVRFVVAWRGPDEETAVLLPDLHLSR